MDPLAQFSAETRAWFEHTFDAPTPAQAQGWPVIATGAHTLIQAPTGSGKTLAAFLYGIDRLTAAPGVGSSRSIPYRKAASVFPDPVGAWISVCAPEAITGQPFVCAGVGASNVRSNQARVSALKTLNGSTQGA